MKIKSQTNFKQILDEMLDTGVLQAFATLINRSCQNEKYYEIIFLILNILNSLKSKSTDFDTS